MTGVLRREQMSVGQHVGLLHATGQLLHGVIEQLDTFAAYVWISDKSHSLTLPVHLRGYQTRMTYDTAEAGGMWAEPAESAACAPTGTTGADLLAFWTWARECGLFPAHAAANYQAAVRSVLAAQPDRLNTEITADPAEAVGRFTAANHDLLAPNTLTQYASGYRRARQLYLGYHVAGPDANRLQITLADGRSMTVTAPGDLTDADRRHALTALTAYLAPAPEPGPEYTGEPDPGSTP
jgi:hypothetical protein